MKKLFVLLAGLFLMNSGVFAAPADHILISEVQYDAVFHENRSEWFELFNPTPYPISLSGWTIEEQQVAPTPRTYTFQSGVIIYPGEYLLVTNQMFDFQQDHPGIIPDIEMMTGFGCFGGGANGCLQLNNTTNSTAVDYLILKNQSGSIIDQVIWGTYAFTTPSNANTSICRILSDTASAPAEWSGNCLTTPGTGLLSYAFIVSFSGNTNTSGSVPLLQTGVYNPGNLGNSTGVELPGPGSLIKEGWTFSGWNIMSDGTGTGYTAGSILLSPTNLLVYAQRVINQYLVTFVDRDSTVLSTGMANHGSGAIAPANPIRTGYTFSGWNMDFSMITGVTIVTGEYTVNQYTINFDTDGGTTIASITDDYGTGIIAPANPTKTGYTFSGWVPTIPTTMPAMDVTVTGQWIINSYTLSYTGGGADGGSAPISQTGDYNSSLTLAANTFTRVGYTFSGWNCGAAGSGYIITMDTECTAQWELNEYLVTFQDWDTTVLSTGLVNHGSGATAPVNPTRIGYTFSGWNMDFTTITGAKIITAEYMINQYGITFNSDGGTPIMPITGDYNSAIPVPENPTKIGYTFSGWSPVLPTTMPATNTTVTAQWTINSYTLSYVAGTGGMLVGSGIQLVPYLGTGTSVTAQAQPGYRFIGWSDNKNQASRIDGGITGNRSFTANFILIPNAGTPSSITPQTEPSSTPTPTTPTPTPEQPKIDDNEDFSLPLTENDKVKLLNPSFTQSCFDYKDEKTIDQGVKVSETFLDAHQLFYSYSLTKRQGTNDYRPFSTITREEAARFFVEFAKNVLCRKPNYTYTAQFSDMSEADNTLASFIKASYEFGIFHGDGGKSLSSDQSRTFRPKALMTQDELAAVIVRLVTNEYDETGGDDRSSAYRQFLKNYAKTTLQSSKRENIAEVVYDIYRWNEYVLQDIGYVIKK